MALKNLTAAALATMPAQEYALLENAERRARAEAEGWDFYTLHPEDDEFWANQAEYGVVSAADLIRRDAIATHSDSYKEMNGIRPRWVNYDALSTEEIEAMTERLYAEEAEEARRAARKAEAMAATPLTHNPFAALREE